MGGCRVPDGDTQTSQETVFASAHKVRQPELAPVASIVVFAALTALPVSFAVLR